VARYSQIKRPWSQSANPNFAMSRACGIGEPVEVHFLWRPQVRDPSDEMVLEAAINGQASALVTYNVTDFALAGERFAIPILRPADLLKKVRR
jgi:predicted nucleic acid-binding protein